MILILLRSFAAMADEPEYEAPARTVVRSGAVSSMSSLLLQGYAMLASSCPTCGVPLMRKPASDETLCVNCDLQAGGAAAPGPPPPRAAAATPSTTPQAGSDIRPHHMANGIDDVDDGSSSADEAGPLLVAPPRPLRERLYQQQRAEGPAPGAAASSEPAGTGSSGPGSEEASQRAAELMLQGWAMLAEHCPRCHTPLLRSRQGRLYCAGCDMYALREGSLPPQAPPPGQHQQHESQAEAIWPPAHPASPGPNSHPLPASPQPSQATLPPRSAAIAACSPRQRGGAAAAVAADAGGGAGVALPGALAGYGATVERAAAAVAVRMEAAAQSLRHAADEEAPAVLDLLRQCADTLAALADSRRRLT